MSKSPQVCVLDPSTLQSGGSAAGGASLPPHLACETDCEKLLNAYLACAQAHTKGMTKDDECVTEKIAYKMCASRERAKK